MMRSYQFTVIGHAEPAGSKKAFVPLHPKTKQPYRRPGGGVMVSVVDANPHAKEWKKLVAKVAREECGEPLLTGPLKVTMTFYRVRPQGHYGVSGLSKAGKETPLPITKPDAGKLARGTIDAMTGVIYVDDAQIVEEVSIKRYGTPPRVEITIEEIEPPEAHDQTLLFETLEVPPPWEKEVAAAPHQQTAGHTQGQAGDGRKKRGTSDAGKSRNVRDRDLDRAHDEPPPWDAQDPAKPEKKNGNSQGR